jgi:hypothetical protein
MTQINGLCQYHALCVAPAPPEVLSQTWRDHAGWVEEHVSQDSLIALYLVLVEEVGSAGEDDELYDACDVVWYALTEESLARAEALIDEKCRVEDPERYRLRMAARARTQSLASSAGGGGPENSTL